MIENIQRAEADSRINKSTARSLRRREIQIEASPRQSKSQNARRCDRHPSQRTSQTARMSHPPGGDGGCAKSYEDRDRSDRVNPQQRTQVSAQTMPVGGTSEHRQNEPSPWRRRRMRQKLRRSRSKRPRESTTANSGIRANNAGRRNLRTPPE